VLQVTDDQLPATQTKSTSRQTPADDEENDDEDEEMDVETTIAKQIGEFDEIVIWEHGGVVDGERDGFVRGLGEWVGFAEKMHVDKDGEEEESRKKDA
jgi:ribonuclease H2 subunit C